MDTPQQLGKYPVTGVLGKGAMGVVYRAHDPVIKRPVAIKTISREFIQDDEHADSLATRFRKEAQAAGALNHPGIVAVYEYGQDGEHAYIVMECVEGKSLRDYFNAGVRFDTRDAVSIMAQLLDALSYAHEHAVWHRDIKPANIIITPNGRVKLADFGVARIDASERTQTNMLLGTPGFIAPEYYLGGAVDHRIDLFAAGCVFYQLLTGKVPFRGTAEAIMHSVCYLDPEPPSRVDGNATLAHFDAVTACALAKRPGERYPSAIALRTAILTAHAEPARDAVSTDATIAIRPAVLNLGGDASVPRLGSAPSVLPALPLSTPSLPSAGSLPTGWDGVVLGDMERALARFIGPMARVHVRRAARVERDLSGLALALGAAIADPSERDQFLTAVLGHGSIASSARFTRTGTSPSAGIAQPAAITLTSADVERVTRTLAAYVGPIAKVLAKRALDAGLARGEFYARLAETVFPDSAREKFLREIGG